MHSTQEESIQKNIKHSNARNTLDVIPQTGINASQIIGIVKHRGKITGYELSNGKIVSKEEGVSLAKKGKIKDVGIAHRNDTEYLKSLPDGDIKNNLSTLPVYKGIVHF